MQETWVQYLGQKDPLEKEMATHCSILAWIIPWTEKPGGLQSMGLQRVGHNWVINTFTFNIFLGNSFINCPSILSYFFYFFSPYILYMLHSFKNYSSNACWELEIQQWTRYREWGKEHKCVMSGDDKASKQSHKIMTWVLSPPQEYEHLEGRDCVFFFLSLRSVHSPWVSSACA